jgi:hypothetical protein
MLRTRGALVAAVTALAVGLAMLVGRVLLALVALIEPPTATFGWVAYAPLASDMPAVGMPAEASLLSPVGLALATILPFTAGYFLALWVIAPITHELRAGHVITRSILATGVGATLWFVSLGLIGTITMVSVGAPGEIAPQLGHALVSALTTLITLLPLGVLGGVLQWVWRTGHPSEHHIEGLIDV